MADSALNTPMQHRLSPASHLADVLRAGSEADSVSFWEVPFLTMIGIRVDPAAPAARRIESITAELPRRCGETSAFDVGSILWLGPQEFLVVADPGSHADLGGTLQQSLLDALEGDPGQVVDLSANRTTFELSGPYALRVLQKGCSLDLDPRVFSIGSAVSTEVGSVPMILWRTAAQIYRVLPRASYSEYTVAWVLDAMREYTAAHAA